MSRQQGRDRLGGTGGDSQRHGRGGGNRSKVPKPILNALPPKDGPGRGQEGSQMVALGKQSSSTPSHLDSRSSQEGAQPSKGPAWGGASAWKKPSGSDIGLPQAQPPLEQQAQPASPRRGSGSAASRPAVENTGGDRGGSGTDRQERNSQEVNGPSIHPQEREGARAAGRFRNEERRGRGQSGGRRREWDGQNRKGRTSREEFSRSDSESSWRRVAPQSHESEKQPTTGDQKQGLQSDAVDVPGQEFQAGRPHKRLAAQVLTTPCPAPLIQQQRSASLQHPQEDSKKAAPQAVEAVAESSRSVGLNKLPPLDSEASGSETDLRPELLGQKEVAREDAARSRNEQTQNHASGGSETVSREKSPPSKLISDETGGKAVVGPDVAPSQQRGDGQQQPAAAAPPPSVAHETRYQQWPSQQGINAHPAHLRFSNSSQYLQYGHMENVPQLQFGQFQGGALHHPPIHSHQDQGNQGVAPSFDSSQAQPSMQDPRAQHVPPRSLNGNARPFSPQAFSSSLPSLPGAPPGQLQFGAYSIPGLGEEEMQRQPPGPPPSASQSADHTSEEQLRRPSASLLPLIEQTDGRPSSAALSVPGQPAAPGNDHAAAPRNDHAAAPGTTSANEVPELQRQQEPGSAAAPAGTGSKAPTGMETESARLQASKELPQQQKAGAKAEAQSVETPEPLTPDARVEPSRKAADSPAEPPAGPPEASSHEPKEGSGSESTTATPPPESKPAAGSPWGAKKTFAEVLASQNKQAGSNAKAQTLKVPEKKQIKRDGNKPAGGQRRDSGGQRATDLSTVETATPPKQAVSDAEFQKAEGAKRAESVHPAANGLCHSPASEEGSRAASASGREAASSSAAVHTGDAEGGRVLSEAESGEGGPSQPADSRALEAAEQVDITSQAAALPTIQVQAPRGRGLPLQQIPDAVGTVLRELVQDYFKSILESSSRLQPRGLVNTGNLCFMNAILQALLANSPFCSFLKLLQAAEPALGSEEVPVLSAFSKLAASFEVAGDEDSSSNPSNKASPISSPKGPKAAKSSAGLPTKPAKQQALALLGGKPLLPDVLYPTVNRFNPRNVPISPALGQPISLAERLKGKRMAQREQEDAQEFLGFLLDSMHEELMRLKAAYSKPLSLSALQGDLAASEDQGGGWVKQKKGKQRAVTQETGVKGTGTVVQDLCGGQYVSQVKAAGAPQSDTTQPFTLLTLDILPDSVKTISDAITRFTEVNILEDYKLRKDGPEVSATQRVLFLALPRLLIVHLSRFAFDLRTGNGKVHKRVHFDAELQMKAAWLAEDCPQRRASPTYELIATVTHLGTNAQSGHYVARAKQQSGGWLCYDDANVTTCSLLRVLEEPAYLLFYQLKQ